MPGDLRLLRHITGDGGRPGSSAIAAGLKARGAPAQAPGADLIELRLRLLDLLGPSPAEEDSVIRDLGVSPAHLAPALLDLELEGRVIRLPGGRIALAG